LKKMREKGERQKSGPLTWKVGKEEICERQILAPATAVLGGEKRHSQKVLKKR